MDTPARTTGPADLFGSTSRARWLVFVLLALINGAVLWNAGLHDPRIGYDAPQHLKYARTLATGRSPQVADTDQFYAPPLPYVVPAAIEATTSLDTLDAARIALVFQAGLSIALCIGLLAACQQLRPGDDVAKIASLALLGMPAAYYRTFAMIRGEPYLALLTVASTLIAFGIIERKSIDLRSALGLGMVWALLGLSRQWGFLIVAATGGFLLLLLALRHRKSAGFVPAMIAVAMTVVAANAWFYRDATTAAQHPFDGDLQLSRFGTASLGSAGLGWPRIVQQPGRPAFRDEPLAILYSDWWGDYHYYFLHRGEHRHEGTLCVVGSVLAHHAGDGFRDVETNHAAMSAYLGRVNLLSIVPTLVLLAGLYIGASALARTILGRSDEPATHRLALLGGLVLATLAGHLALLSMIGLGGPGRDAVKATYDLQLLPPLALLGGEAVSRLHRRAPQMTRLLAVALLIVALHGYGTAFTRWPEPQACLARGWDEISRP